MQTENKHIRINDMGTGSKAGNGLTFWEIVYAANGEVWAGFDEWT